ncbi:MAG: DUF2905 family protein [Thermodesulfobacteriota bacterium]
MSFYFPLATSIIVSIVLSILLSLFFRGNNHTGQWSCDGIAHALFSDIFFS